MVDHDIVVCVLQLFIPSAPVLISMKTMYISISLIFSPPTVHLHVYWCVIYSKKLLKKLKNSLFHLTLTCLWETMTADTTIGYQSPS